MSGTHTGSHDTCDLTTPTRNHYFYGKLLDTYHFEQETEYFNYKRRLINRLIHGYGVVCGLDVGEIDDQPCTVRINSGLAIDKHGREIVVPCGTTYQFELPAAPQSGQLAQPPAPAREAKKEPPEHDEWPYHLLLCYHECLADPAPVHASDCKGQEPCQPSTIQERFKITAEPGHVESPCSLLQIPDVIRSRISQHARRPGKGGGIDYQFCYEMLVEFISRDCPSCADDPCIPLANLTVSRDPQSGECCVKDIDITVRPIVYGNDLLFQLLLSLMFEPPHYQNVK